MYARSDCLSCSYRSRLSAACANEARQTVLSFFRAPPGYTVVFTANATGALKLVGESFPFAAGSAYVLGTDSHNSVHGIRQFAHARGAEVCYIESTDVGGFDVADAKVRVQSGFLDFFIESFLNFIKAVLARHQPRGAGAPPCLFAMTGQSNISNSKNPLSMIEFAASRGYCTLLDAAALAPTSVISLTDTPVDAMAISFYKMFGFPTGVGALVVKESFLASLERPWFAGGTVDVVQAPGKIVTMSAELHERFEVSLSAGTLWLSPPRSFLTCASLGRHYQLPEPPHDNGGPAIPLRLPSLPPPPPLFTHAPPHHLPVGAAARLHRHTRC